METVYGVDFGWTHPSAIIAVKFDSDGRAYAVDEFYQRQTKTFDRIAAAKEMIKKWGNGKFICDPSEPLEIEEMRINGLNAIPNTSKREDGLSDIGGRLALAGDGRYRLYVSSQCVNLISELQTYDANKKENDDAVDSLRYSIVSKKAKPKDSRPPIILY
jgi:hypothetical protein